VKRGTYPAYNVRLRLPSAQPLQITDTIPALDKTIALRPSFPLEKRRNRVQIRSQDKLESGPLRLQAIPAVLCG